VKLSNGALLLEKCFNFSGLRDTFIFQHDLCCIVSYKIDTFGSSNCLHSVHLSQSCMTHCDGALISLFANIFSSICSFPPSFLTFLFLCLQTSSISWCWWHLLKPPWNQIWLLVWPYDLKCSKTMTKFAFRRYEFKTYSISHKYGSMLLMTSFCIWASH